MTESQSSPTKAEHASPHLSSIPAFPGPQSPEIPTSPSAAQLGQSQDAEQSSANDPLKTIKPDSPSRSPSDTEVDENNDESVHHAFASTSGALEGVKISFGKGEPQPRWLFVGAAHSTTAPATGSLQSVHSKAKMVQPPVQPVGTVLSTTARATRMPGGMGVLAWTFDAGDQAGWNGLSFEAVHHYAYSVLENVLNDPIARENLRNMIRNSELARKVSNVEDPLPPLPPPPQLYVRKQFSGPYNPTYAVGDYARPSLARKWRKRHNPPTPLGIVARLRRHAWGDDTGLNAQNLAKTVGKIPPSINTTWNREAREMAPSPDTPMHGSMIKWPAPTTAGISLWCATSAERRQGLKHLMEQFQGQFNNENCGVTGELVSVAVPGRGLEPSQLPRASYQPPISYAPTATDWTTRRGGDGGSDETQQVTTKVEGPKAAFTPGENMRRDSQTTKGNSRKRKAEDEHVPLRRNPPRKAKRACKYADY